MCLTDKVIHIDSVLSNIAFCRPLRTYRHCTYSLLTSSGNILLLQARIVYCNRFILYDIDKAI